MKQFLLSCRFDALALSLQDKAEIFHSSLFNIESVGTLANDQLATYLVTRLCKSNGVFIDVGAHIGSSIAEVKRNSNPSKIHAVEAIRTKANEIQKLFPFAIVHNFAAGDIEGEVTFFENTKKSGYSCLLSHLIMPSTAQ